MLKVYNKDCNSFNNNGLCVLQNAYNICVHEIINAEYTLTFTLPRNDSKFKYIKESNFVKCEDQLFRIKKYEDTLTTVNVSCEHVFYDLSTVKYIPFLEWIGWTPAQILTEVLQDTPFSVGTVEISDPTDLIMSKTNPMEVIAKLIENVGGELLKDNYTISLVSKLGNVTDVKFKLNKNIKSIRRTTDATNIITRLYPYGKDDLDISTVNNNVHYIDSPLIQTSGIKIGTEDFKDIEDPTELKIKALKKFSNETKDGIDKPQISYKCDIIELKKLGLTEETFHIGDTITIEDEYLNINTAQRITDYSYYPYEAQKSNVTLINYDPNDYVTVKTVFSGINKTADNLNKLITADGNVIAQYVNNIQEKLQTEVNSLVHKSLLHNTSDMYVDNINDPTKAMLIGAGIFAIANSKKANGDWDWRTIATGDRVIADEVDVGWVYTGGLSADQITAGTLSADRIDATNLQVAAANITGTIIADTVASNWVYAGNILADQITAGTISANMISGGTLSGVTLNVNTNATIGKELMIGSMQDVSDKYIKFGDNMYIFTSSDGLNLTLHNYEGNISNSAKGDYNVTAQETLQLTGLNGITLTTGNSSININGASLIFENRTEEDGNGGYYDIINTAIGNDVLNANTTGFRNTVLGFKNLYSNTTGYCNTAVGYSALYLNTTGDRNVAIGDSALCYNTTGSYNVAVGMQTLRDNTTGICNVAIGDDALKYNTTGRYNVAVGFEALICNTTGSNNVAVGADVLFYNTTGNYNTAVGYIALCENTTGNYNTAVGNYALCYNTTGDRNVAVGNNALINNETGYWNTAVGCVALRYNTTGYDNVAIGGTALYSNTTGYDNVAIGDSALYYNTTGYNNTAVGDSALFNNTTGSNNVAIGLDAGIYDINSNNNEGSDYSIYIGNNTKSSSVSAQNEIIIGYDARGYGDDTAHIGNSAVASISFGAGTGTAFTNRSDRRLKEDIMDADTSICYNDIKNLPLHRFKYKDFVGNEGDKHLTGFIADEFEKTFPKAVFKKDHAFPVLDENGNKVMKTITEEITEVVEDEEKVKEIKERSIKKRKEKMTAEEIAKEKEELKSTTKTITKTVEKQVEETFVIEQCASIDTSQLTPTIVGALKALIDKVEMLETEVAMLKQK